ncbi:zf-CHY-domain-containing protein, partial [Basidiobolus meristosporus CBS 931.73]
LGCKHYRRNNKLRANCCGGWFTCRFCHNDASDHQIIRKETKTMMCMYCQTIQPAAQHCVNERCGREMARYFCPECVLWDDTPNKSIYHCPDCGICRVGQGLDKDYFHCKKCNVCMAITLKNRHKCIERNLESDCPICGEYMFTSTTTVIFMPCGHCIHYMCHRRYVRTSYQCPTCLKSLADMTQYFRSLDALMESQQMPPQYDNYRSIILCNDCEKKSVAKYHFLYHKCVSCKSYNTKTIKILRDGAETELVTGSIFNPDGTISPPEPGAVLGVNNSSNITLVENGMDFDQDWSQNGHTNRTNDISPSEHSPMDLGEGSGEPELDREHF